MHGESSEPQPENVVENVCHHPLVEEVVTLMAQNIRTIFPREERSAAIYNRITHALNEFAREVAEKMLHADLQPIDTSDPKWRHLAGKLEAALGSVGLTMPHGENNGSAPLLFEKLAAEFSEIPPERWTEGANINKLRAATIRVLEFVGVVTYLMRLKINPMRMRER